MNFAKDQVIQEFQTVEVFRNITVVGLSNEK